MKLKSIILEIKVNNPKYDIIHDNVGNVFYFKKDINILHRVGGPSIIHADGTQEWFQNGRIHRLDGPAIERANGDKSWFINGKEYSEEDFERITNTLNEIQITNPKNSFRITPKGKDLISKVQILDDLLSEFGIDIYEDINAEKLSFVLSINAMIKDGIISLDGFNDISMFYDNDYMDMTEVEKNIIKMKKYGIII